MPSSSRPLALALALTSLTLGGCIFVRAAFPPSIPVRELKAPDDDASIARGQYLAEHVAACTSCHSPRDYARYAGPAPAGTEGAGGETWDEKVGFPGRVVAPNITPGALADWSDGEILRAMVNGVSKDGTPLFPIMPYPAYQKMSEADALAIVAYLRTLPASDATHPPRELGGPLGFIVNAMPKEGAPPSSAPAPGAPGYGEYLAEMAHCVECHTATDNRGRRIAGEEFGGGREFKLPSGLVRSANITPDKDTGIGSWTRDAFVARFRALTPEQARSRAVAAGEPNTPMPWSSYVGMTDEDLGAIYDYLMTQPPLSRDFERFEKDAQ